MWKPRLSTASIFKIISGEFFVDAGSMLGSQGDVPGKPGELLLKPGQASRWVQV